MAMNVSVFHPLTKKFREKKHKQRKVRLMKKVGQQNVRRGRLNLLSLCGRQPVTKTHTSDYLSLVGRIALRRQVGTDGKEGAL